jgi:glycerol uptake facilitator-like aquaporin
MYSVLVQEFFVSFVMISLPLKLYTMKNRRLIAATVVAAIVFTIGVAMPLVHGNTLVTIVKCAHSHITVHMALAFFVVQLLGALAAGLVFNIS